MKRKEKKERKKATPLPLELTKQRCTNTKSKLVARKHKQLHIKQLIK